MTFTLHEIRPAERRESGSVVARINDRGLHVTYTVHSTASEFWIDKVWRETGRGFVLTDRGVEWLDDLIHSSRAEGYGSLTLALSAIAKDLDEMRHAQTDDDACCDQSYVTAHGEIGQHQPWCHNK